MGHAASCPRSKSQNRHGKFEVYSFELAEKFDMLKRTHPNYPDLMFASPLPVHLEPRRLLQKPRLGPDEFVPATGFTPLSSFTGSQARDNPILVALHHRMEYANVFINEVRPTLGLQEGDRWRSGWRHTRMKSSRPFCP